MKRSRQTAALSVWPGGWAAAAAVPWERRMEFKFCNYRNRKGEGGRGRGDALRDSPIYRPIAAVQNPDKMIESFVHPRGKSQIGRVRWTESQNSVRIKSR